MIAARSGPTTRSSSLVGYRWHDFDPYLLVTTLVLMGFGVVAIWSAGGASAFSIDDLGVKQAAYGLIGLLAMIVVANIDYRFFASFAWLFYSAQFLLLTLVLVPGVGVNIAGSQRWFFFFGDRISIQPSEICKIATIITLAAFISSRGTAMREFGNFIVSMLIVAIPMGLIFLEPDLGSTLVYGVIWVSMMVVTQTRSRYLITLGLMALPAIYVAWNFLLHPYQRERLLISYRPYNDPLGDGFNIIQARISIGSGGWLGDGLSGGSQSQMELLKVRESDFIFAHASGMFGYLGMMALLLSFVILLWRCLKVVTVARDSFGQCLAIGITGVLLFQATVNIGMNVGLMPVTGITLPFVSAGSSSLWTFLFAEGLLQSILMRHRKLAFQPR